MKWLRVRVTAAALASLALGAQAQEPAEPAQDAMPPFGIPSAPAAPKPAASHTNMFAAASAALAKRLSPEQREERHFLKDASAASRFQFEAARIALSKSTNAGVRNLAATLVSHHSQVTPTLQQMLHSRGLAAPMLANDQRKTLNRLAKIGGSKFDREFVEKVGIRAQHEEAALYEHAAAVQDPQLRAWVEKTLPEVQYNVGLAERTGGREAKVARAPRALAHPQSSTQVMGAGPLQPVVTQPVSARLSEPRSP